jgi:hypothetical protein
MSRVKCFYIEKTDKIQKYFRRYKSSDDDRCDLSGIGCHNATIPFEIEINVDPVIKNVTEGEKKDERFPKECICGYKFTEEDTYQIFKDNIYVNIETGEEKPLREWEKIPGAIWNADWYTDFWKGPDGKCLIVVLPNQKTWVIDSVASNCTLPDDKIHKCWVRHGEVPNITVDKNGLTCSAGGGSILVDNYVKNNIFRKIFV